MLDTYVWSHNKGICLPKSASKFLRIPFNKNQWNWIWTLSCPKKIQILIRKSMHERLPTCQFITFSRPNINDRCPRCNSIETTSHILWDCPWAKVILLQSPGILPLSFFQLPLKIWLKTNSKLEKLSLSLKLPWNIFFLFLLWQIWLSRNDYIFNNQSISQTILVHKIVQLAIKFYYLACPTKDITIEIPRIIKWIVSSEPFIKLNTNGSSLGNPGLANAGGILHDYSGN